MTDYSKNIEESRLSINKSGIASSVNLHSAKISSVQKSGTSSKVTLRVKETRNPFIDEKYEFMLLESQVRRMNKRIQLEQQIVKNKKLFNKIEEEIQREGNIIKEKKRQIIQARLDSIEARNKERERLKSQADKQIALLNEKEEKKKFILKKILARNQKQHEICYQNALMERKSLFKKPLNFKALNAHERNYLVKKKRHRTSFDDYEGNNSKVNQQQLDTREQDKSNTSSKVVRDQSLSLRYKQEGKKDFKSSIEEYLQSRRREEKRIQQIKSLRQKSKEYGNIAQQKYSKNRAKTEGIEFQKQKQKNQAEKKAKQINEVNKILKSMKKPNLPQQFNGNISEKKKRAIQKVVLSTSTVQQKMKKLNIMSEVQLNHFQRRNCLEDLQRLNEINMIRADLLLNLT